MSLLHRDALAELDALFHTLYDERRDEISAALTCGLAQIDDELILRLGDERLVGPARTQRYHDLKMLSHLPLAVYVSVDGREEGLDRTAGERLAKLRGLAEAADAALADRDLEHTQRARQHAVIAETIACIDALLADDRSPVATVAAYLQAQLPAVRANMADAARDQLSTMHATFCTWAERFTPEQWSALQVVVATSHAARTGNLATQYFAFALRDNWQGRFQQESVDADRRVLSSEVATDEPAAFLLLATRTLDDRIAKEFFHDRGRMGRDVLADPTEQLLQEMFGDQPGPPR